MCNLLLAVSFKPKWLHRCILIMLPIADGHHGRTECLEGRCHSVVRMSLGKPAADPVAAEAAPVPATSRSVSYHKPLDSTQCSCLADLRRVPQPLASKDPLPYPIRLHAGAQVVSGGPRGGHPIPPRLPTGRLLSAFSCHKFLPWPAVLCEVGTLSPTQNVKHYALVLHNHCRHKHLRLRPLC